MEEIGLGLSTFARQTVEVKYPEIDEVLDELVTGTLFIRRGTEVSVNLYCNDENEWGFVVDTYDGYDDWVYSAEYKTREEAEAAAKTFIGEVENGVKLIYI